MRLQSVSLVVAAGLGLGACATVQGQGFVKPGLDVSGIHRIAVVEGNTATFNSQVRQTLVDAMTMEFFRRGWVVVDRSNVQTAINELNFQNSDMASQDDRRSLGNFLNVDAIVIVNIAKSGEQLAITARMMDVETGKLLWMGSGEGAVNSTSSVLAGAILGTAVGAMAGHNMGDNASVGAIAGGIAGGAIGRGMSPSQLQNAKRVVARVCETLPVRVA